MIASNRIVRLDPQVRGELIDNAYRGVGYGLLVEPLAAGSLAVLLWSLVRPETMGLWLSLVLASSALRAILWQRYRLAPPGPQGRPVWGWLLTLSLAAAGGLWGAAPLLPLVDAPATAHLLLFGVVALVFAAFCGIASGYLPAAYGFVGSGVAVLMALSLTLGTAAPTALIAPVFGLIYGSTLLAVAHHVGRLLVRSIELRLDLARARDEAQSANEAKSEFIANMSHEIRTPLNAIIGFSEMMIGEMFGPLGAEKYKEYVNDILASGNHLMGLLGEILDLSKIEASKLELDESECNLAHLVQCCATVVNDHAEKAGVRLMTDTPPNAPSLWADERALKQILMNLLSNAIKFTPVAGEVSVTIVPGGDGKLRLVVEDTGIGIAAEDIPKAMDPFGRIESTYVRQYEGTGLGLPLVKALIELHDGSFRLQSRLGVGTSAIVEFPARRVLRHDNDPAPESQITALAS